MEAEEEVLATSGFGIRSDGAQEPFSVSPIRHHAGPPCQQDCPSVVPSVPPNLHDGPTTASSAHHPAQLSPPPSQVVPASTVTPEVVKKKRGRPRKYGPDGSVMTLSPMPISASIPHRSGAWPADKKSEKKKKKKKKPRIELESLVVGEKMVCLIGANFTPHVLTVNPGEDVTMKIMSFSQEASRPVCVLSANGTISNVTLRHPTSLGGTLTYEGRFEILSLSGSYTPVETGGTVSRSGGTSISWAGADGRVIGGGLTGLLVAAGPVRVVLGSFLPGHQLEQKSKNQRAVIPSSSVPPVITNISARDEALGYYDGEDPIISSASDPFMDS